MRALSLVGFYSQEALVAFGKFWFSSDCNVRAVGEFALWRHGTVFVK